MECFQCKKKFEHLRYRKDRKFCSKKCCNTFSRLLNPERAKKVQYKYRIKNKDKIKVYRDNFRKRNIIINKEEKYAQFHKDKIIKIIGSKCALCTNNAQIHHLSYNNLLKENIKEYCKYLMPLCSSHHKKFHLIMNKYGGIE